MSIDDVINVAEQVLQQNRNTIVNKGTNGMYQIEGIVDGVEYVLGLNNGRVGQLNPK
ncbi:MAG TPA: hypothetical protein DCP36_14940 [Sporomusaceae bacterium]|nr:hypothetical protein [Sporomusaceae bacterium]